jgi:phage gp36-like protein
MLKMQTQDMADILEVEDTEVNSGLTSEILNYCESVACDQASAYLSGRYDMPLEFAKTGTTRSMFIVNLVIYILIKNLYDRVSADSVPSNVLNNYNQTLETLRDIQNQRYTPKIEERTDEDKVIRVYSDSNTKISYDY